MKYWTLILENYEDENDIFYFENYDIAKQNFDVICKKHKNYEEFEKTDKECSWFDPEYNEFSTFVLLAEREINIYNEIIF